MFRLVSTKVTVAAAASAFVLALGLMHGPTLPPDPWAGSSLMAHGPTLPPDPWAGSSLTA